MVLTRGLCSGLEISGCAADRRDEATEPVRPQADPRHGASPRFSDYAGTQQTRKHGDIQHDGGCS
jgi:hypothetical protein